MNQLRVAIRRRVEAFLSKARLAGAVPRDATVPLNLSR
jgi:hypothetical protein